MPYIRPSLDALRRDARAAFEARLPGADAGLRFSALNVLADVQAALAHLNFGHLDWIARQVIPSTAEADFLDRWAGLHGLARRPATRAAGSAMLTGSPGTVILEGSRLTRADGTGFVTMTDTLIEGDGTGAALIEADAGGESGNAAPGVALTLSVAVVGVSGTALVTAGGLTGGAGAESDASLRERLVQRLSSPPQGGARRDYIAWSLAVTGITRVWVYPRNRGPGTVDVAFVMDGRNDIIPSAGDVAVLQAVIDEQRPVTDDCIVFAPVASPVNITITGLTPNTAEIRAAILVELADQIRRDAEPGGTTRRSRLIEAVSRAVGENHHTMTTPSADVAHAAGNLATLGTVSFA